MVSKHNPDETAKAYYCCNFLDECKDCPYDLGETDNCMMELRKDVMDILEAYNALHLPKVCHMDISKEDQPQLPGIDDFEEKLEDIADVLKGRKYGL